MRKPRLKLKKGKRYNNLFFSAPTGTTAQSMGRVFDSLLYRGCDVHVRTPLPKLQPLREDDGTWRLTCSPKDQKRVIRYLEERFGLQLVRSTPDILEVYVTKDIDPELQYDDSCG